MRLVTKRRVAVGVVVLVLIVGGIAAFAYFTSSGTGTGTATVGSASPWRISGVSTSGGPLLPGSGTETVSYTVNNDSNGVQHLSSVVVTVAADGSGNVLDTSNANAAVPGCLASWFSVDNAGAPLAQDVAGAGSVNGSAAVTLPDSGTNQDPCQGVSPELTITAS